jgi:hypothetical protein
MLVIVGAAEAAKQGVSDHPCLLVAIHVITTSRGW